jgi:hypothetical protein
MNYGAEHRQDESGGKVTFIRKANIGTVRGEPGPRNRIALARSDRPRKRGRPQQRSIVDETLNHDLVSVNELKRYVDEQRGAPRLGELNAPLPPELLEPNLPSLSSLTPPAYEV